MFLFIWLACATELPTASVRHDTSQFLTHPWPSHERMTDGHPDLSNFPNPTENPLITKFVSEADKLDGFGNNSPIYFPLDGPIDVSNLPSPQQSLNEDVAIHLINIDPASPYRGERIPLQWDYQEESTNWQPAHFLSLAPVWGFPLRPDTLYAAVLTTDIVLYDQGFPEFWSNEDAWADVPDTTMTNNLALLQTWEHLEWDREYIASFTIFKTQDPIKDMVNFAYRIESELESPVLSKWVESGFEASTYTAYDGDLLLPLWQYGQKPYSSVGGGFSFEDGTRPKIFEWESAKFRISVPTGEMPDTGWPVAIYSHGTGGSYSTYADGDGDLEPAKILAESGFMGIGISQPIHADRGTGADPEIYSFNFLNPTSARAMFRQGALDQIYLAKMMSAHSHTFDLGESEIMTDPNAVVYVGHSHGGEVGAIALPFIGKYVQSVVLSGAGGGLSVTLMEREQEAGGLDIQELLRNAINLSENEILDTFHPAVGLVQMLAEVVDPINYARYWYENDVYWNNIPANIFMTEGMSDAYTPPASIEILAATAGLPIVGEAVSINDAHKIKKLGNPDMAQGNRTGFDGTTLTGGLVQYPDDGHFAIFYNEDAGRTYGNFLSSTLSDDEPIIAP